jgi:hypothetical protein
MLPHLDSIVHRLPVVRFACVDSYVEHLLCGLIEGHVVPRCWTLCLGTSKIEPAHSTMAEAPGYVCKFTDLRLWHGPDATQEKLKADGKSELCMFTSVKDSSDHFHHRQTFGTVQKGAEPKLKIHHPILYGIFCNL